MEEEVWHVLPINDLEEHEESSYCKCDPEVQVQENGNVLIIHNSFDGREGLEMANEILNQ
jgi:hypothetical protein